ncbi:MAG: hypothetical protein AB7Q42_22550 [Acidimicrobiia bacterium]
MTRTSLLRRSACLAIAAFVAGPAVAPATGISAISSIATPSAAAAPATTAKPRVSLLGDSTMMAMNESDKDVVRAGYDLLWDAESCRRLVNPSCRGRFGSVPVSVLPLISTTYRGSLGEAMVVMAGYDDYSIPSAVDALMSEAMAQGVARVVFLTFREHVPYVGPSGISNAATFARHNDVLRDAAAKYPSLYLADWNAHSSTRAEWFYSDGIHLTPAGSRALAQFIVAELGALDVGRCTAANTGVASSAPVEREPTVGPAHAFESIRPVRVLDTREPDLGGADGMLAAGRAVEVPVGGAIDGDASAVIATVTAVDPCKDGFLSVYPGPCSQAPPLAATVNFVTGRTTANLAITALGSGTVCAFSSVSTDLVVDVLGSVGPTGSRFTAITPARFVDTRGGSPIIATVTGRRVSHVPTTVPIAGRGEVPGDTTAVLVNVTAVQPDVAGFVSLYPGPCDGTVRTSTLSTIAKRDTGAATIVGLGPDGSVCAHSSMGTDLVLDVQGWFGGSGLLYRSQTPTRVLDTRSGAAPDSSSIASAGPVLLNIVADRPTRPGFLRAAGCGVATDTAILNFVPGEITGNVVAVAPAGSAGSVCIGASWPSHVVADLSGTFVDG